MRSQKSNAQNVDASLRLDWCSHKAAKYACVKWHYSGTMPPGLCRPNCLGVWEFGSFIGVVIFGRPGVANIGSPYGLSQFECCELQRVALTHHKSQVSRIVRIAIKLITEKNDKLRLIVSFADPAEGHHGGIYQAGGWIYTGTTAKSKAYFDSFGKKWHSRCVGNKKETSKGIGKKHSKESMCDYIILPGKHRYLYPLDKAMREQIESLRKPYPKRAGSIDDDATGFHSVEGGSIPTPALQVPERGKRSCEK